MLISFEIHFQACYNRQTAKHVLTKLSFRIAKMYKLMEFANTNTITVYLYFLIINKSKIFTWYKMKEGNVNYQSNAK